MTATYRYSADGVKLEAKVSSGTSHAAGQPTAYAYLGSLVYSKVGDSYQLESTGFSGGRIVPGDIQHPVHYHITDHLGSVRVVAWPEEGDDAAVILEQNDYYPYGMRMNNGLTASTDNRYRFSGKETQPLMGGSILDFGARYYNPTIARWTTIDPKAEKYYSTTPYSYCAGNPVMYVDPDGEMPQVAIVILGATVGATVNIISGVVRGDSGEDILKSALAGAVEGGISSLTGLGLVKNMKNLAKAFVIVATEITSSATGSALEQYLIEGEVDGREVVIDVVFDAATDYVGGKVGERVCKDILSDTPKTKGRKAQKEYEESEKAIKTFFDNLTTGIINYYSRVCE